ncbi:unnamed protein product [Scytosiphon promiscuus]
MVKNGRGSSTSLLCGQGSFPRGMRGTLKAVVVLAAAVLHHDASSLAAAAADTPTGTSGANDVVAINEGLLVTGSVRFGAVPIPNLCVELRGYQRYTASEDGPSASSAKAVDGSSASAAAAASAAGGRAWQGWGEGEPRFLQLGRTEASDGSFTFVTPESGVMLALAAYSPDGDHPAAVRVHIDLLTEDNVHAQETLWTRATADFANDRSPCARREAANGRIGGGGGADAATASVSTSSASGETMANPDVAPVAPEPGLFPVVDLAATTLMALGRSSLARLSQLGADLWDASADACAALFSGREEERTLSHENSAAESPSVWSEQSLASLSTWYRRQPSLVSAGIDQHLPRFVLLWWRKACAWVSSHLDRHVPYDLHAWWAVWWVRVFCIALLLVILQEAFRFITRPSLAATGVDPEDTVATGDNPGRETPRQDVGTPAPVSMVATVHNSDGTVSKLDFAALDRPVVPATAEKTRRGILGSMWGGSRSGPAEETRRGPAEEEADEFSSMFRALSKPACEVSAPATGGAGRASNFVVVTQEGWTQQARGSQDY